MLPKTKVGEVTWLERISRVDDEVMCLRERGRALGRLWTIDGHRDSVELLEAFMDPITECRVDVLRDVYFARGRSACFCSHS
jgi:hypothetical protein